MVEFHEHVSEISSHSLKKSQLIFLEAWIPRISKNKFHMAFWQAVCLYMTTAAINGEYPTLDIFALDPQWLY